MGYERFSSITLRTPVVLATNKRSITMQSLSSRDITILIAGNRPVTDTPLIKVLRTAGYRVVFCDRARDLISAIETHTPDLVIIDAGPELWQAIEFVWVLRSEERDTLPFIIVHADEGPSFSDLLWLNDATLPLNSRGCFTSEQRKQVLRVIQQLTHESEHPVPAPAKPEQIRASRRARAPKQLAVQPPWWANYSPSLNVIRGSMVLAIVLMVTLSAISAMISPTGVVVFEKVLPILTLSAGYLFGRQGDPSSPKDPP
jgi:CheY-like chemotaxis protein